MPARSPDPYGVTLRRAARVTVVGVPLFYLLGWPLGLPQAAGPAVFAVFTLGSFADFAGRPRRRALRYLAAGGVGLVMFPIATAAATQPVGWWRSPELWPSSGSSWACSADRITRPGSLW